MGATAVAAIGDAVSFMRISRCQEPLPMRTIPPQACRNSVRMPDGHYRTIPSAQKVGNYILLRQRDFPRRHSAAFRVGARPVGHLPERRLLLGVVRFAPRPLRRQAGRPLRRGWG